MRLRKFAFAFACCGLLAATAFAQGLRQPTSVQNVALRYSYFEDEPAVQPSPSDITVAPPVIPAEPDYGYSAACGSVCDTCVDECGPWRLLPALPMGITVTGWVNGGATASADSPVDRNTRPIAFNDRHEVQMNQFYTVIERPIDTSCQSFDIGGRVDVLYGTDARFTEVRGWELNRDGTDKWNTQRFYRLSLPQMYAEFGYNDLSVKVGHWYTTIGYEVVTAPDNFFYSHAYTMAYGEPFTHTGVLATYDYSDRLSLHTGIHNGWDMFDAPDTRASILTGGSWTSCDERIGLALAITSGDEINNRGFFSNRTMYSLVASLQLTDNLQYLIQHDNGWQIDDQAADQHAEWYGINQYLLYTINDCWKLGGRMEWFRDDDGVRVTGDVGNFYNLTAGLNWTPSSNLIVRPEARWDWYEGVGTPFDAGTKDNQFTAAIDAIVLW